MTDSIRRSNYCGFQVLTDIKGAHKPVARYLPVLAVNSLAFLLHNILSLLTFLAGLGMGRIVIVDTILLLRDHISAFSGDHQQAQELAA